MENEPQAELHLPNSEVFLAKRDTATLWTFMGKLAVYNHVFCAEVVDQEVKQSFYVFNFIEGYDQLTSYMVENQYPAHLNLNEIGKNDVEAYERAVLKDLHIRPDWLPEI